MNPNRDEAITALTESASGVTRRGGLGRGLKLAFTAPAVLAALPLGVAAADSGKGRRGNGHSGSDHSSSERHRAEVRAAQAEVRAAAHTSSASSSEIRRAARHVSFRAELCRVTETADFSATKGASATLGTDGGSNTRGVLRTIESSGAADGRVQVHLVDALASATYQVLFVPFTGDPVSLGSIATNGGGDFRGFVKDSNGNPVKFPDVSGKSGRAGLFVLRRDAGGSTGVQDQFVTCIHG